MIHTPSGDVAWNMAVDETLWESIAPGDPPTLCLHDFDEECVTLGFAQPAQQIRSSQFGDLPWTRRLTGGGAIHHHGRTISFSLIAHDLGEAKRPGPIACALGRFLVSVWERLGLETRVIDSGDSATQSAPLCADRLYAGDVLHGDAKVAGIGQRFRRGRLLVQAALMLDRAPSEETSSVGARHAVPALEAAIGQCFRSPVKREELLSSLEEHAMSLRSLRYLNEEWRIRRRKSL
ncbi:lipoate--protein ligase family protein [Candidatus Sumerlaeota bacterium]|nr:lipoate--protein ligase family protein [Candidatus Sumerlaeota bacterium]